MKNSDEKITMFENEVQRSCVRVMMEHTGWYSSVVNGMSLDNFVKERAGQVNGYIESFDMIGAIMALIESGLACVLDGQSIENALACISANFTGPSIVQIPDEKSFGKLCWAYIQAVMLYWDIDRGRVAWRREVFDIGEVQERVQEVAHSFRNRMEEMSGDNKIAEMGELIDRAWRKYANVTVDDETVVAISRLRMDVCGEAAYKIFDIICSVNNGMISNEASRSFWSEIGAVIIADGRGVSIAETDAPTDRLFGDMMNGISQSAKDFLDKIDKEIK